MDFLTDEARCAKRDALLEGMTIVRGEAPAEAEQQEPTPHGLSDRAARLLIAAAHATALTLLHLYSRIDLHVAHGRQALKELEAAAMVRPVSLVREKRGARPQVLQVLPPGREELARRGLRPELQLITRGSPLHDVYGRIVGACAKAKGAAVEYEATLGKKAFDLISRREGQIIGVEIVLSGAAPWNAEQALKGAGVAGVGQVLVVSPEKKLLAQIERELGEQDALGLARHKVSCWFAGRFVERYLELLAASPAPPP